MNEKTIIALGFTNHDGLFNFKLGASNTLNGNRYMYSIFENYLKCCIRIQMDMNQPGRSTFQYNIDKVHG